MAAIKLRGGTAAQWTSANPVLAAREVGVETDTGKLKVGNGTSAWSALPYFVNQTVMNAAIAAAIAAIPPSSPGSATEGATGVGEIATTAETTTGTDDFRWVTPLKLQQKITAALGTPSSGSVALPLSTVKVMELFIYTDPTVARPAVPSYVSLNWVGPAGSGGAAPTNMAAGDMWDMEVS